MFIRKMKGRKSALKRVICLLVICTQMLFIMPVYPVKAAGTANDIVNIAKGEVGVSGTPNKYTIWFGKIGGTNSYLWCHAFVSWCAEKAGCGSMVPKTALCQDGVTWFRNRDQWRTKSSGYIPRSGDIIYFGSNGASNHVGIVTGTGNGRVYTIEGNARDQVKVNGGYSNGYAINDAKILGYGVPSYQPLMPIRTCLDGPNDGKTYYSDSDKILISGWAISPDGVRCVNVGLAGGPDLVQCSFYPRTDVSNAYPGYPTGSEGFYAEVTPAQLQLQPGANTIVVRAYTSSGGGGTEVGIRTINYEPNHYCIDTSAENLRCIVTTADLHGWVISKLNICKIAVVINDVEYEVTNRYKRSDVSTPYPDYDVSRAGFSYQIDPTKFQNGMNSLKVKAYTSATDYFEVYNGTFEGVKLAEVYFDANYYYARYKDSDADVRNIGQNEEKLKYHYYTAGIEKGYSPCISFDGKYYKENNSDLANTSYKGAYEHFVRFVLGNGELLRPLSPWLNLRFYRDYHAPEFASMNAAELFYHHRMYGSREGRLGASTQEAQALCKLYNPVRYANEAYNADLHNALGDGSTNESRNALWNHFWWTVMGRNENRQMSDDFAFGYVKETYNLKSNMDAFWWYMNSGYSQNAQTIKKAEETHTHELVQTKAVFASCTEAGNREYWTCSGCQKVYGDADANIETTVNAVVIPETGHTWDEGTVTKQPTGLKKGIKTYTCTRCGETRTAEIAATGEHMLIKAEEQPADCQTSGSRAHWICTECDRIFEDENAETEIIAADLEIPRTDHIWDEGKILIEPAADRMGVEVYTCVVCGNARLEEVSLPGEVHKLVKMTEKAATCTSTGHAAYWICTDCGKVFADEDGEAETTLGAMEIPKTAHAWDSGIVAKEPSVGSAGEKTYTCLQCGATRMQEISSLEEEHILFMAAAKDADCLESGNREYWNCIKCGKVFADPEAVTETTLEAVTIPKKEHSWDEGEVVKEPTAADTGIEILTCTVCGWIEVATIPATGEEELHHELLKVEASEAGCLVSGNKEYWICENCGKLFTDDTAAVETTEEAVTIPAAGHTWDEGKVTKEPTATMAGQKTYTCVECGTTIQETIAPIGGVADEDNNDDNNDDDELPEVGDRLIDEDTNNVYLVTQMEGKDQTVEYVKPGSKSANTVIIPKTVTIDGYTYTVTSVAPKAFANNKKLEKMIIGENVETIGKQAFSGCTNLTSVTLGAKVKTIGNKAFYQCTAIEKITIPSNVSKIGAQAFYKCKNMKVITIKTTKLSSKRVGIQAFKGLWSEAVVKVPKGKVNTYRKMLLAKGLSRRAEIKR